MYRHNDDLHRPQVLSPHAISSRLTRSHRHSSSTRTVMLADDRTVPAQNTPVLRGPNGLKSDLVISWSTLGLQPHPFDCTVLAGIVGSIIRRRPVLSLRKQANRRHSDKKMQSAQSIPFRVPADGAWAFLTFLEVAGLHPWKRNSAFPSTNSTWIPSPPSKGIRVFPMGVDFGGCLCSYAVRTRSLSHFLQNPPPPRYFFPVTEK
jgi:hypothetical protein